MKAKPKSAGLAALLDDDDDMPAKPKAGAKLAALMDDDEDMPPTKAAEPAKAAPVKPQRPAPAIREPLPLSAMSLVHCGTAPVLIITGLSSTWSDLLCYNYEAQAVMHLKREDLLPVSAVNETISSLREHLLISPPNRNPQRK